MRDDRSKEDTEKMDVTQIPFNKFIEISHADTDDRALELGFKDNMKNHLGTFHASAQFALAEACSGLSLQNNFPRLAGFVVPVLRRSELKFKNPAQSDIRANARISNEAKEKFELQLEKKGRAVIAVPVEITDKNGAVTMTGTYEWFVQTIRDPQRRA
ncbi:MAG: YiiD C-terminal domain-containing protein [Spirochaetes bacterium]|nr:YiiD C-terminal domain-containing protein [Spirochaetota bacterium]